MAQKVSRTLQNINKELKDITREAKAAENQAKKLQEALSQDPKNTAIKDAIKENISDQIQIAISRVDKLKEKQAEMAKDPNIDKTGQAYKSVGREITLAEAELKKLKQTADGTAKSQQEMAKEAEESAKRVKEVYQGLSVVLGGIAVACSKLSRAIDDTMKVAADTGKEIAATSAKFGIGAEELQRYSYAFEQVTGDANAFNTVLVAIQKQQGQAQNNVKKTVDYLNQLGIDAKSFATLSSDEALDLLMKKLGEVSNESERAAIATGLLNDAGIQLSAVLKEQGKFDAYYNGLSEAAIVSDEAAQNAKKLSDNLAEFQQMVTTLKTNIGAALEPLSASFKNFMESISDQVTGLIGLIANLGQTGQTIIYSLLKNLPILIGYLLIIRAIFKGSLLGRILSIIGLIFSLVKMIYEVINANTKRAEKNSLESAQSSANQAAAAYQRVSNDSHDTSVVNNNVDVHLSSNVDADEFLAKLGIKASQIN